jgi:hypothetical protein
MALLETNWRPTPRQLRQFGVTCLVALPLVGWIWSSSLKNIGLLAAVGLAMAAAGLLAPRVLLPAYIALVAVATPVGMLIGELIMLFIFFGVFLPIGLVFRMLHRDALQIRADPGARSYWQPKRRPTSASSYYRQS